MRYLIFILPAIITLSCLSKKSTTDFYRDEKVKIFSIPDSQFVKGFYGGETCLSIKELETLRPKTDSISTVKFHPVVKPNRRSCIGLYEYEKWRTNNRADCGRVTYKFLKFEDKIVPCSSDTIETDSVLAEFINLYGDKFSAEKLETIKTHFKSCKNLYGLFLNN